MYKKYVFVSNDYKMDWDNKDAPRPIVVSQEEVASMESPRIIKINDPVKAEALITAELTKNNWSKAVKVHYVLYLRASIAVAKVNMLSSSPSDRAIAEADKAEAEMLLAQIEMDDAENELSRYDGSWDKEISHEV